MLAKERPTIVSVADRWLDAHAEMVIACAEAGASVFLEKPMARTLAEADAMIEACERHHAKLAVAFQTRVSPRVQVVKDLIAEGRIGELVEMHGRGKEDARGGGEDLMVLGSHILDLMRVFAGDARTCVASISQSGKPAARADLRQGGEGMGPILGDSIHATYSFDRGVVGTFGTRLKNGAGGRFGLTLLGSAGMCFLAMGSLAETLYCDDPTWKGRGNWRAITSAGLEQPEPLSSADNAELGNTIIARDLIESIEKDHPPRSDMYAGRASLEMVLSVYESYLKGRVVELPLANRAHPLFDTGASGNSTSRA
jgi:predicted dehydrogenase